MAAASTNQALTEDYSCGYCLQRLNYMIDPRELPCSHAFCLPCLQSAIQQSGNEALACTICGSLCGIIDDLNSLKKPLLPDAPDVDPVEENVPCDMCKEQGSRSVCYCIGCDKKLCDEHLKIHEDFGLNHKTVALADFKIQPAKYQRELCLEHGKEIVVQACSKCLNVFCLVCQTGQGCTGAHGTSGSNQAHTIHRLETFADSMREKIKTIMKSLSDKISEICRLEKTAWNYLDGIEIGVYDMIAEVERITEEQILEIRKRCSETKKEIEKYLCKSTQKVEQYTAGLMGKKEKLQDLWKSTNGIVLKSGHAKLIGKWKDCSESVDKGLAIKLGRFKYTPAALIKLDKHRQLEREFTVNLSPFALELFKLLETPSSSVFWENDGVLLVSGTKDTFRFDDYLNALVKVGIGSTNSSVKVGDRYVMWREDSGCRDIEVYSDALQLITKVKSFAQKQLIPGSFQQLAVLGKTAPFIALDSQKRELLFFSTACVQLLTVKIPNIRRPQSIHTAGDGGILITDFTGGSIHKYSLNGSNLVQMWTCTGLVKPTGIATDEYGYISVGSYTGGRIYTLSVEGELLATHKPSELQNMKICSLSVKRNVIAVACMENGVKLFNILRK